MHHLIGFCFFFPVMISNNQSFSHDASPAPPFGARLPLCFSQSRWYLMHECPTSKQPKLDWNTKWARWPPKDSSPLGHFYIQTLTPSWLTFPPTDLRLCYKAAANSVLQPSASRSMAASTFLFLFGGGVFKPSTMLSVLGAWADVLRTASHDFTTLDKAMTARPNGIALTKTRQRPSRPGYDGKFTWKCCQLVAWHGNGGVFNVSCVCAALMPSTWNGHTAGDGLEGGTCVNQ